jgi:hypothetical protein
MSCVILTAKVRLLQPTAKCQIICQPKNKVFLAGEDKKQATERQEKMPATDFCF